MDEEHLFHEALARSTPQERSEFLDSACAGRPELRAAVESLLTAHDRSGAFLLPQEAVGLVGLAEFGVAGLPPHQDQETDRLAGGTDPNNGPRADARNSKNAAVGQIAVTIPPEEIPKQIGRYHIRRMLGRGGMGTVYLAHDPELDRLVALKVPKLFGSDAQERFLREARAAAALHHPNLCPVYDAGRADGVHFLTMAYVPGMTLTELLRQAGPLSPARAAGLAAGVARGMAEAQRHGIVHRDLKPGNILLDGRGEPVVTDFGLALRANVHKPTDSSATAAWDPRLTEAGVLMGTPAYMPPEQVSGDLDLVGPASDIYALGAILFELLTGRPPFQGANIAELARKVETEPAPLPSAILPGIPAGLDAICRRALAKDPAERWPSMEALADALVPFAAVDRRLRKTRIAIALAAAVPLMILAAVIFYIQTDNGQIEVRLNDPNADVQVSVDGKEVRLTDNGRVTTLRAGPHALEVKGEGFQTETRLFKVTRGEEVVVEVELKPAAEIAATSQQVPEPAPGLTESARTRLAELLARGQQLVGQGRFGELGPISDEALEIDAESPGGLALRATYRAARNEILSARADVELALELNPETHRARIVRAHLSAEAGQHNEAIADFTVAIRLNPADPVAWSNRAGCYFKKGDYRQAVADADRAIQLSFPRENAYLNRAAAYACLGELERAIADYDSATKMAGDSAQVLVQRSAVHAKMGNTEKAAQDFRQVQKLDPSLRLEDRPVIPDPPPIPQPRELSVADAAALVRECKSALAAWDDHRDADFQKAVEAAVKLDPASPAARSWRALLFGKLDRADDALAEANEAIQLDPSCARSYTIRGLLLGDANDFAGEIAEYTIAMTLAPEDHEIWNNRGYAYLLRNEQHQALADLHEALRLRPDYVSALANRGLCLLQLGEYEQALSDYEAAVRLQPTDPRWREMCSVLKARLGDAAGSRTEQEEAIKLDPQLGAAPDMTLPAPRPPLKKDPEWPAEVSQ